MKDIQQHPPHNVELEQQVLGAVLTNNALFHRIGGFVDGKHFFDPVHADIWRAVALRISKDSSATPVTLKADLEHHEGLKLLGGPKYLAKLASASMSSFAIKDYATDLVELSSRREIIEACNQVTDNLNLGGASSDAASELETMLQRREATSPEPRSMSLLKAHTRALEQMEEAQRTGIYGVTTGLHSLNKLIGGLKKKDLILIAGATSMGKTTLGTWLSIAAARDGHGVGFVSREMSEEALSQRIASIDSLVPYEDMGQPMEGEMFRRVAEAMKRQEALPIQIYGNKVTDIPSILSESRRLQSHWTPNGDFKGFGLLVIDYIQMIRGHGKNRFDVLSQVSEDAKNIAGMLDVPVVALAQIARDMSKRDSKVPHLGDLRGSGDLENAADIVMFTHRPEYYLEREEPPKEVEDRTDWEAEKERWAGKMEIIVGKRRMGRIGRVTVNCDMATNRFWDIHKQDEMAF